ncbi:MAG: hypothetical protein CM1200mP41_29150 [Gammaproteobacteria bacterium]|nr:MAG: hypothetical protein CM1200mP41_29150 [Gammaproteobacteria bacterium]
MARIPGVVLILSASGKTLYAKRDWGGARDYVEAQWLMLQQEDPKDYVICEWNATQCSRFHRGGREKELDMGSVWEGSGLDEKGIDSDGRIIVAIDPRYYRPTEVESFLGDPSEGGANPLVWGSRTTFQELVAKWWRPIWGWLEPDERVHSPNDYC